MKTITIARYARCGVATLLTLSLASTSWAGPLAESAARAAAAAAAQQTESTSRGVLTWAGSSLFVGGLAVGLYSFINNRNGEFTEFGEADASNNTAGVVGLAVAALGGALIVLGHDRSGSRSSLQLTPSGVAVSRSVTW